MEYIDWVDMSGQTAAFIFTKMCYNRGVKKTEFFPNLKKADLPTVEELKAVVDAEQSMSTAQKVEGTEKREQEPTEVARLFLFQSRKPEEILDTDAVADMHFTEMLLIHKGGDVNAGQVMPLGGKIDEGENPLKAAIREAVEEAHLRPPQRSIRAVGQPQDYSFDHPRHGRLNRKAYYYKGKIGPQDWDVPYQTHPEEDKIKGFVRFSPQEAEQLLATHGYVERNGVHYEMQDALNPNEQKRIANNVETNPQERADIAENIVLHHILTDARKKMMIILELLTETPREDISEQGRGFIADLYDENALIRHIATSYKGLVAFEGMTWEDAHIVLPQVDAIWNEVATQFTPADIRMAFQRSDHAAKLSASFNYKYSKKEQKYKMDYNEKQGKGVPTAALIFPLLLNDNLRPEGKPDIRRVRELYRIPTMAKMMRITQKLKATLRREPELSDERVIEELHSAGLIEMPRQTYDDMSLEIDIYFEQLRDAAGLEQDEAPIDQLDEIKLASLTDLFRFASSSPEQIVESQPRVSSVEEARVFIWEAQRKLALLWLLNDAVIAAETLKEQTTEPIDEAQEMARVALDSPLRLYSGNMHHKKRPDGTKELMSLLRKMIVRDQSLDAAAGNLEVAKDYFAESYVFNDLSDKAVASEYMPVPEELTGRIEHAKQAVEIVYAPPVVRDLMYSLLQQDPNLRIIEYKPLPESGGKVQSSGGGGGGKIRYAKFYLEHTDPESGLKRHKEIQVFIPDPITGLSGAEEFKRKKVDDRRYGVQRLFHTKGIRSFMELLFPAVIYDQFDESVHKIHRRAG